MAQTKILARDVIFQVETTTPNTWLAVSYLNSATLNPAENEEVGDATTFESAGQYEGVPMQRGAAFELEGLLSKDNITGVQDPGQARVEVLAAAVGYAGLARVRFRHPLDTEWQIWTALFSLGEQGGGNNDLSTWGATITRSGAKTTAAV
ncbi:hypothetical protein M8C13_04560 [Crossiella sp. SN42]|uniref:phage tail tube protein n=1 Tax=Crossiella sp. SN42 TaxID=2944808 RepID=UPI00207CDB9F|nr:hypothetical protein [Crossiella sp. SN42]MCO1575031.1 hypothetical protein [Crossiella sp. SN42]